MALALGQDLGSGGEAVIYALSPTGAELSNVVAKIYHTPSLARIEKLKQMMVDPPEDPTSDSGHVSICWPQRLIYDSHGSAIGFLMPRIDIRASIPVFKVYNPMDRNRFASGFNWEYLVRTGANIASVVAALHDHKYVVGDINESNLLVSSAALVTLVDCDSIQVPLEDGGLFRCPVGKPEFTAPELQDVDFASVDRNQDHDSFALAVLIFMLLMEGVHPYAGVWKGSGEAPAIESRIKTGDCPYVRTQNVLPMPIACKYETLPPSLRNMFQECFGTGHTQPWKRPHPFEWREALSETCKALTSCKRNRNHRFGNHLRDCPWCERALLLGGVDPFGLSVQLLPGKPPSSVPKLPGVSNVRVRAKLLYIRRGSVFSYTLNHMLIGLLFVWLWRPLGIHIGEAIGTGVATSNLVCMTVFVLICFFLSCYRVARPSVRTPISRVAIAPKQARFYSPMVPKPATPLHVPAQPYSPAQVLSTPVVGSARMIFHAPGCEWARKIAPANRVNFKSVRDARAAGYRQCKVCRP